MKSMEKKRNCVISERILLFICVFLFCLINCKVIYAASSKDWRWPTTTQRVTAGWRYSDGTLHGAVDYGAKSGSSVYSTCDGRVDSVKSLKNSYGKHVIIKAIVNGETVYMYYCHLSSYIVKKGDKVKAGQLIGYSGNTGKSTGPHLHYEVRNASKKEQKKPELYLPGTSYSYKKNEEEKTFGFWDFKSSTLKKSTKIWWKETGYENCTATIYIDGIKKQAGPPDKSGYFWYKINVNEYVNGNHTLKAVLKSGSEKKTISKTIYVDASHNPIGCLDIAAGGHNNITIKGWAADGDVPSESLDVHVYVGGPAGKAPGYSLKADISRPDVQNVYPGMGTAHGFNKTIAVSKVGKQPIYVYAINRRGGSDQQIGTAIVNISETKSSPIGHVDAIGGGEGVVGMSGWAYDPDNVSQALKVKLQLVGGNSYTITADGYRTGVAPTNNHGFSVRIPVKEIGTYNYKVYALDIGKYSSSDTLIGSGKITINPSLTYQAHVQSNGWLSAVKAGETAGTTGKSKQMEAIKCTLLAENGKSGVKYQAHCRSIGWQGWKNSGEIAGTVGQSLRIEAVQFKLCNGLETKFNIEYRAHVRNVGWGAWVRNGQTAGTTGQGLPIEAVQIRLVAK